MENETTYVDSPITGEETEKSDKKELADKLTQLAISQLSISNKYKEPLLEKWKKFTDAKAGKVKKKLRVNFQVNLPVFSGMLDTLAADFDEPIELSFKHKHPSDYFKAQRIQASWNVEKSKTDLDAKWDYKSRVDKGINILYGRSILKEYAESDPKYHNVLSVTHPLYFHCQPTGGGLLENHLWLGEEGILRDESSLDRGVKDGTYDKGQVEILKERARSTNYESEVTQQHREKMMAYKAIGLDPDSNNFIGETTFKLCEWGLTYKGVRYYLLFDPWTATWIRCEKLKDIYSSNLWPWVSWSTFEDYQVFWSKSYADEIFPVADAIVTLFNQELTNREKRNMGARAYDKDMFPDMSKLDAAQFRPDALVPADTKGGTRKIADGIYWFQTPELQGTINLLDWTNKTLEKETGVTDISQGASLQAQKKVNVAYMEQASIAKRIGFKSQAYTECWEEIGSRFICGLKDNMSQPMFIEVLGDMGIEPDVMTREDLDLEADLGIEVISSTARKQENQKKKQNRIDVMKLLIQDQNMNSEWRTASLLRDIGEYDEEDIKLALDTKNYATKEAVAKAHIAIQTLLGGKMPDINYSADGTFLKIIFDYMMDHRNKLGVEKGKKFTEYISKHAELAQQNGVQKGKMRGMRSANMGQQNAGADPSSQGVPTPQLAQPEANPTM